jgi:Tol biopolymer transport system component/DNA-binding winged helix-turn-helix (wHTH) protein
VIRFGLFELDFRAGKLRKQGRHIKLQDQPLQLLELLLSRPGELVTREELQQALWPADTFVEFDQGLNTAIKKIRLALGDSADNPRFVETIPRKGYRFIAPVDGRQTEGPALATVISRRRRVRLAVTLFGLTIAAGAAGWWLHTNRTTEQSYVPVPLTSYPGDERSPTFSPDGNQVAFSWQRTERPGVNHIYVKLIGAYEPVQLTRDEDDDLSPAWSPDGRFIAFLRSLPNDRSGVFLIPAPGGPARKLGEVWSPHDVESPYLAWHPNGKWLVVMDKAVADQPLALFLLSVETGEKRRLTTPPQRIFFGDVGPAVSPDGRAVVFSRNNHDLFLQELSEDLNPKSQPKQLTFGNRYTASPAWSADGRAIVFSSGTPHGPTLYKILLSQPGWRAGKPERLAFAGDGARQPAISRQGCLSYVRFTIDANIWRMQLNGGLPPALPPAKLIASTHLDHTPRYSPDGKRIAFASNRSGSHEIWVCNSDGSGIMRLTSFGSSYYTAGPRWSPDGRQIYFGSNANGKPGVYVIDSDGGRAERVTDDNPTRLSHDGKWNYFDSSRSGEPQLWKIPAHGGPAIQITRKGGGDAQESPDGRFLYYLREAREFTSLWKVPVSGGDETQVVESVCCSNFAVVDQGIYFIPEAPPGGNSSLKFLSFVTGKVTTLAQLSGLAAYGFSVSPNGRWLLYSQYEQKGADLMLVENFR